MANTQININENGTTTLATAGKYCDRNIDVNVNVPGKATQFTNLYDPANVTIDQRMNCSSANGLTFTADSEVNYIKIPYKNVKGGFFMLRTRGIALPRSRYDFVGLDADGETYLTWGQLSSYPKSFDEYGDMVIDLSSRFSTIDIYYLIFNFQYNGYSSATEVIPSGPIITINEPIGNGGVAT